jgi:hypothetical protein
MSHVRPLTHAYPQQVTRSRMVENGRECRKQYKRPKTVQATENSTQPSDHRPSDPSTIRPTDQPTIHPHKPTKRANPKEGPLPRKKTTMPPVVLKCPICFKYEDEDMELRACIRCWHVLCGKCANKQKKKCPLCQQSFESVTLRVDTETVCSSVVINQRTQRRRRLIHFLLHV